MPTVDFNDPEVIADPYPALAAMRERAPVQWNDSVGAWCVLPYAEVRAAFTDPRLSSDRIRPFARHAGGRDADIRYLGECISLWMVFNDPPTHTRLRTLVSKAFGPAAIEAARPAIAAQVERLLATMTGKPAADFVEELAYPLPANVIAALLGVPAEDVGVLKRWSDELARFVLTARADPAKYRPAAEALRAMNDYFTALVAERRARPGDAIIDRLVTAHEGEDRLTLMELIASCVLLLFAGHETTTHFFSSGLRALAAHPRQWARLVERGNDATLVRNAVNEMLRWDGPSLALSRVAAEDLDLAGASIRRGDRLYLFVAAANRDPLVFDDPDDFDVERPDARKMITFGQGIHVCLGIHLAWLEGEVAWPRVARALDGWRVDTRALAFTETLVMRGVKELPIHRA